MKPLRATVAGTRFLVAPHAIERYAQRASSWPDDPDRARRQLGSVVAACGRIVGDAPGWLRERPEDAEQHASRYLMLGDDITLPLVDRPVGLVAVTCIARGGVSDKARAKRREYRARRRRGRQEARKQRAWLGEAGPRWR